MGILTELQNIKSTRSELKNFGLTVGVVLLGISIFISLTKGRAPVSPLVVALFLIISSYFLPSILKPFQKLWMGLALVLGFFSTRIILTILFVLAIIPTGLVARLFHYDPLGLNNRRKSYWREAGKTSGKRKYYEKQF